MFELLIQIASLSILDDRGNTSAHQAYEEGKDLMEQWSEQERKKQLEDKVDTWLGRNQ